MKVEYTYKTSDGKRHVETMNARSTDAAFAILRERGIKPIRVVRAKPEGFVAGVIYSCTSTAGIAVAVAVIPLAWLIPMTVHSWGIYKGTKPNTVCFGVCTLIFANLIGGILLLVSNKDA